MTPATRIGSGHATGSGKGAALEAEEAEMKKNEVNAKSVEASKTFLRRRGYEILDPDPVGCEIVAKEGDCIVFVRVFARSGAETGFPACENVDRGSFEIAAARWLSEHPDQVDLRVRFDVVSLLTLAESRALIRHHINALSSACDVPEV